MNTLNSILLEGVLVIKDPDALIIKHDDQYFRIVTNHTSFSIGDNLRIVGRLINIGGITIVGEYIHVLLQPKDIEKPKTTDVRWFTKCIFKDSEGYWFTTEDEDVLGPYKTFEQTKSALDAYVKAI